MAELKSDGKMIFLIFIGTIITIVFLSAISDQVFTETNTFTNLNETVTGPAINGTVDLIGRELVTSLNVINASNATSADLLAQGIALQTGISSTTGLLTVQLSLNDSGSEYVGQPINASYIYNPDGYVSNGGARAITLLIVLFGALAILVYVVVILFKEGSFSKLLGRS